MCDPVDIDRSDNFQAITHIANESLLYEGTADAKASVVRHWTWLVLAVVAVSVAVRLWHLTDWSLWEDEEGSIFYALNLNRPFPRRFPVFFRALHGFFAVAGESVSGARIFSACIGLVSLGIVYICVRRLLSRQTALLTVLFLSLSVGHVFWSQSVRYYTAVLGFEVLSLYWFYRGFEESRLGLLLLANAALAIATLTHFSAALLVPVLIAFLGIGVFWPALVPRYRLTSYLVFAVPLLVAAYMFTSRIGILRRMGGWVLESARNPIHVLATAVFYIGPPLMLLAAIGVIANRRHLSRAAVLMAITAVVPLLELLVLAELNFVNVTWYYAFVSVVGFSVLAADWLLQLFRKGFRWWASGLLTATLVYSLAVLAVYFTSAYGDRPRWREAGDYISRSGRFHPQDRDSAEIFATAPGVLAFYLGVPANETQRSTLVQVVGDIEPPKTRARERWYVIPAFELPSLQRSLLSHCALEASFDARTGPRDRSLRIYYCP